MDYLEYAPLSVVGISLDHMREYRFKLNRKLYNTPAWRVIRRHRLAYELWKLDQDISLIAHALGED